MSQESFKHVFNTKWKNIIQISGILHVQRITNNDNNNNDNDNNNNNNLKEQ